MDDEDIAGRAVFDGLPEREELVRLDVDEQRHFPHFHQRLAARAPGEARVLIRIQNEPVTRFSADLGRWISSFWHSTISIPLSSSASAPSPPPPRSVIRPSRATRGRRSAS